MKAITYARNGGSEVLALTERAVPEPEAGEVRVRVRVSGVNPTDWKSRSNQAPQGGEQVPNQDGAGIVDAVGAGVDAGRVGQRVWVWEAARQRLGGSAQEYLVVPEAHAVPLPDEVSFEAGASLGIPGMTAHRALTLAENGPRRLAPGALAGQAVLVAGGAGAVGNAAIQLARWAGATVIATVSGPEKAKLAESAGAHHTVNYRAQDAAVAIRALAPDGVALVVDVAVAANAALDLAVVADGGTIGFYADDSGQELSVPVRASMTRNLRWIGILVYTLSEEAKADAVAGISAAVADGGYRPGPERGLPWHQYELTETAAAHDAVEGGVVGKVLVSVAQ